MRRRTMRPRRVMASIRRMSPLARTLPLARLDGMVIAATDDQVPDRGLGALGEAAVDQAEVDEVAADMALTCGVKGLEPLAFWMQTIFFAYFYVAQCRLTSRLPGEIVADRRWVSPGVGLRWLFVWLF